jgi:hypothetical protein
LTERLQGRGILDSSGTPERCGTDLEEVGPCRKRGARSSVL